ncbi:hypothetical protein Phou_051600 [Phytohabitans houttuyneae]|uniref:Uncharacterized protein n=1 Tax=Phytohabitans houttuyneae TaxID=1076126 RepID=A0A6V8KC15_9ACTN|nr:hypothetical protein Phou_051600 [Phytohabitans houttuyneae]
MWFRVGVEFGRLDTPSYPDHIGTGRHDEPNTSTDLGTHFGTDQHHDDRRRVRRGPAQIRLLRGRPGRYERADNPALQLHDDQRLGHSRSGQPPRQCISFLVGLWPLVNGSLTYTDPVEACAGRRTVLARNIPDNARYIVLYDSGPGAPHVEFKVWH